MHEAGHVQWCGQIPVRIYRGFDSFTFASSTTFHLYLPPRLSRSSPKQRVKVERQMEAFSTNAHQHRGHDGNLPAGRRGTFKNKTWVSGERSNSSSPFQAGHLGADAPRWERGGITRGAGRGRGRGKALSPRPEFGSSQQHRTGDVSEVEGDAEVAVVDGTEPSPSDEPVLETLEERERYYQEVSPMTLIICEGLRRNRATCVQSI